MKNLRNVDLNLLTVFEAVLQEGRISSAADRLEMSQPAVSNALSRLRQMFGDELFVRTGKGMQPTPLAQELSMPVMHALDVLKNTLSMRGAFDPLSSQRCFRVAMTDVGEIHFLPELLRCCQKQAPNVCLEVVRASGEELKAAMSLGHIDLAVGPFDDMPDGCFKQLLFAQDFVTLMRHQHPLAGKILTPEQFKNAEHLVIAEQTAPYPKVSLYLKQAGVDVSQQHILPNLLSACFAVASGDWLATVPERLAQQVVGPLNLVMMKSPLDLPALVTHIFWHRRLHQDEGVKWLRALIISLFVGKGAAVLPKGMKAA